MDLQEARRVAKYEKDSEKLREVLHKVLDELEEASKKTDMFTEVLQKPPKSIFQNLLKSEAKGVAVLHPDDINRMEGERLLFTPPMAGPRTFMGREVVVSEEAPIGHAILIDDEGLRSGMAMHDDTYIKELLEKGDYERIPLGDRGKNQEGDQGAMD